MWIWVGSLLLLLGAGMGTAGAQGANASGQATFSKPEIQQMVAGIALYPDSLLSQIFMAATYPIEVIETERWLKENPGLKDDALDAALRGKNWDVSVKSLAHFPDVLSMMSDRIEWTTKLGNAFLAQEKDVLAAVQYLRSKALDRDNLASTPQQTVTVEESAIYIEPVDPMLFFLPFYDPDEVYGPWWYAAYPPLWWYRNPWINCGHGLCYGNPSRVTPWVNRWSNVNWHSNQIMTNPGRTVPVNNPLTSPSTGPQAWQHDVRHRQGAAYADQATAQRFTRPTAPAPRATAGASPAGGAQQQQSRSWLSGIERDMGYGKQDTYDFEGHQWHQNTGNAFEAHGDAGLEHAASDRGAWSRSGSGGSWQGEGTMGRSGLSEDSFGEGGFSGRGADGGFSGGGFGGGGRGGSRR
jgi:hypothetical protein